MLKTLATILLITGATPTVTAPRALAVSALGVARGQLSFIGLIEVMYCMPQLRLDALCLKATEGVGDARAKVIQLGAATPDLNDCEAILLGATEHYTLDGILLKGIAKLRTDHPDMAGVLATRRNELQVEPGPDAILVAACRAAPGSSFSASWDAAISSAAASPNPK
jgi:hypothetical protein